MSLRNQNKTVSTREVLNNFRKSHGGFEMKKGRLLSVGFMILVGLGFLGYRIYRQNAFLNSLEQNTAVQNEVSEQKIDTISRKELGMNESVPFFSRRQFPNYTSSNGQSFSVFSIEYRSELAARIEFVKVPASNLQSFSKVLESKRTSQPFIFDDEKGFCAVTGAMYGNDGLPPGLLINKGRVLKQLNTSAGSGNFYEPEPNGVFYLNEEDVDIVETSQFTQSLNHSFAIQSGPMLVIDGDFNASLNQSSTNKHFRCAVGMSLDQFGKKTLHFVSSRSKVSFYEIAQFMKDNLSCTEALHLESMNAYIQFPGANYPIRPDILVKNLIVVK
jgi:uncharacterized protein YigE (DUF2233 family)